MSKTAVLAEKPSVGRDIARVLNCHKKGNGCIEGDKYIVTWALGHLVTLADPEAYDSKYASWKLEDLPMLPSPLKLDVIKQTSGQYKAVKQILLRKDVNEVVIATDAGREGELVARWILEKINLKKPVKRLWISSVTDKAIKEGFSKLKDGKAYELLYASARARSEADWYVGMNATRALTCKFNAQLSCGRVQTPTLAMISKRGDEIQNFKSKPYFGISAVSNGLKLTWFDEKNNAQSFDENKIATIINGLKNKSATVQSIDKTLKKTYSPGLYDLTELQRDANKIYSFSAKQTLNLMQKLYEEHKVLTYPRTDSRYISQDIVPTLKDRLRACGNGDVAKIAFRLTKEPIKPNKAFVDDSKVSDHHAIIPTEQAVNLSKLTSDERKIYDLVVKRFIAVLLPPFEYEQTSVVVSIDREKFRAKGKVILKQGWKEVYNNDFEEDDSEDPLKEQLLPSLRKGDALKINGIHMTKGATSPPPLYTEGTLLTAMEHPIKNMPYGIGTVATRADIIEKLLSSFLIEKNGKYLQITSKGKQLLHIVPPVLKSAELTADWEQKLELIASGKLKKDQFIGDIKGFSKDSVRDIKNSQATFKHDNLTREKCPDCGKYMLEVSGKKGKMLVCQDRECGYRRSLSRVTNARCPNCHKKLELRGTGEAQYFICKCGHKEKMATFNARRKEAANKGSQKDVQKYLQEQKKNSEYVSPLADALSKLKL
ncbi:DNA topoisomerase III [Fusibacter ferrireducens]|uniref:DNA topoisomerase 3 n=1 Tax=Fusibacter ferrireducens TaxID=2785058 RepID=A0ABR9ZPS0_9FIRM|nr:DNA topoisomerase III [Fusibacter ferrireducens]MBF4691920.1 DNA topoisomerase III [Fusibacter ferrireducens]